MPFTDPTDSIEAKITDAGRALLARSLLGEVSFMFEGFDAGREGYQDANPVKIDPVVSSDTALADPVFPLSGLEPFTTIDTPTDIYAAPVCRIDRLEALYGLGELGIWVRILMDTVNPGDVGTDVLFALAHFPMIGKSDNHVLVYRVIFAF
jgi:hypothetical protein